MQSLFDIPRKKGGQKSLLKSARRYGKFVRAIRAHAV